MKVVFCTPTISKPHPAYLAAMEASVPALDAAGIEHSLVFEVGCPYISHARATLTRKALDAKADVIVYLDHDLSWEPEGLMRLIESKDDVVAGTYRFKKDEEAYMGTVLTDAFGRPQVRVDGCIAPEWVPAGFLKVTTAAVNKFMGAYPEYVYGPRYCPSVDLFHHGAHEGLWYGEDYAFSRNYAAKCGPLWLIPDLNLTHWSFAAADAPAKPYPGNFHEYLLRQPGGSKSSNPIPPQDLKAA